MVGDADDRNSVAESGAADTGLKGLVEGVGRDVLGISEGAKFSPVTPFPGENLDGTVPARARLGVL